MIRRFNHRSVIISAFVNHFCRYSIMAMKAVDFTPGSPENMFVTNVDMPKLRDREVLVKVLYTAINRADTLQRKGKYDPPAGESRILGLEASGIVQKLAPGATKWKVGDRVMSLLAGGGYAEYVAAHEDHLMNVPENLSLRDAAAIPEVWLTAYQLLDLVGRVRSGDKVLIHAGGSGVGLAAVQLTRLADAVPMVTAGTDQKLAAAKNLGAVAGFNYKSGPWEKDVLAETGGAGADVILDCIGESYWSQNINSLATDGRWVLYGLLGGINVNGPILGKLLRKRCQLLASTLRARSVEYKANLVAKFTRNVIPKFANGALATSIDKEFDLEDISEAHRMMESNANTGKIVIRVDKEAKVEL